MRAVGVLSQPVGHYRKTFPASKLETDKQRYAKGLADQLGGIAKVREALDLIEQLS